VDAIESTHGKMGIEKSFKTEELKLVVNVSAIGNATTLDY